MALGEAMRQTGGFVFMKQNSRRHDRSPARQWDGFYIRKDRARAWFERLRDDICVALEAAEDALPRQGAPHFDQPAGRFGARRGRAPTIPARPAAAASWR